MLTYTLIDYFDVWGNAEEGWEVNNLQSITQIEVSEDATDLEIIKKLIDIDYLQDSARELVEISNQGDEHFLEFFEKESGRPLCRLELID